MIDRDRRNFLRLLGATTIAGSLPQSIDRALALPAHRRTGTIRDVGHIVILTQENRSFDHYFGSLRGVRGFSDPHPVVLPSGKSVWHQPFGNGEVLPFHPTAPQLGLQFLRDVAHGWTGGHAAWNGGEYDGWVPNKGTTALTYLTRDDIPYHYALADAFTICDAYFCSVIGPTDPNRYYMWTGGDGNDGDGGGSVIDNSELGDHWAFPELLEKAGISWKVYQDIGVGLDAAGFWGQTNDPYIGNFGDNSLLSLHQYQNAQPGNPFYERARRGTNIAKAGGTLFDILRRDVSSNTLPQVSWIAAPEAYSEHPNWPANFGAWYISNILDALTSNPDVWSKTALFINYDENGGFFDHIVPPTPPQSHSKGLSTIDADDEIFPGNARHRADPYGLGSRVPMIVVSPWSKGGYVCSQVFDHTSLIQFIERRFADSSPKLFETQIPAWRRAVCGDLTSAFDFERPDTRIVPLPSTIAYAPPDRHRHPDYIPAPPANQSLPTQELGLRHARPLPYELNVDGKADISKGAFVIDFKNTGKDGVCFHVRSYNTSAGPWSYTVESGKQLSDSWNVAANPNGAYALSVYGPNGFVRSFKGEVAGLARANLDVDSHYSGDDEVALDLAVTNRGAESCTVTIVNAYTNETIRQRLPRGGRFATHWSLRKSFGWYDLTITVDTDQDFKRHLAGHVETGKDSVSDPAIGRRREPSYGWIGGH
jgi:phospholipase C